MLSLRLLEKAIRQGELTLIDHLGERHVFGEGQPKAGLRIKAKSTFGAILRNPHLMLGETYMNQEWELADCTLHDLLTVLRLNLEGALAGKGWLKPWQAALSSWNGLSASRHNASHHYDLDEPLFRACLDRNMHYSCAYFRDPGMGLEEAQHAKSEHIAAKLDLQAGQRVLDIGSGWGSLALHLAETRGVRVTGLTLSKEQLRAARDWARKRGLVQRADFQLQDYRQHRGRYDRIVSVGMFEHVGRRNMGRFFDAIRQLLVADGVALLHSIASSLPPAPVNPWIRRHIFPGGYIPALSDIAPAVEQSGLISADIEVLRRHYAMTLQEWHRRFQEQRTRFAEDKGEAFCRMWEFYLIASQTGFEVGDLVVVQWLLATHNQAVPITRDYLYRRPDCAPPQAD